MSLRPGATHPPERAAESSLPLLKALSDETRFRCLAFVRSAGRPVSVTEVADALGLHQNTVRPHLERLRDVGLLEVSSESRGTVGRPQHLYQPAEDAPPVGLGPRGYHLLSQLLAALASRLSQPTDAVDVGREWGWYLGRESLPTRSRAGRDPVKLLDTTLDRMGFDPATDGDTLSFRHCPFRELAEEYPELICSLHQGLCEGVLEVTEGKAELTEFNPLYSRQPCTAVVSRR